MPEAIPGDEGGGNEQSPLPSEPPFESRQEKGVCVSTDREQDEKDGVEPSNNPGEVRPKHSNPELAGISKAQMRKLFELAYAVAMATTKSKERSDVIVQTAFERLLTTSRWDGKKPIDIHLAGIVKSVASHQYASEKSTRKAESHDGFHREVVGTNHPSTEDAILESAEDDEKQENASSELDELAATCADHPLAPHVLQIRIKTAAKASEIARALGVSSAEVYRANDVLRRNLRAIRKRKGRGSEEGAGEEEEQ
jgi:DNA-directed RNA polymerase specialized sigma24 family protein